MPYHVLVVPREHPTDVAYSLDLTEQQVIDRVKKPYESGSPLLVSGRTFRAGEIKEVQVSHTDEPSTVVLQEVGRVLSSSRSIVSQLMPPQRWMITDGRFSTNVTDQFLTRPMPDAALSTEGHMEDEGRHSSPVGERSTVKDDAAPPTAFISYSWDDEEHKAWVKQLAARLRGDGVDVALDQWDYSPAIVCRPSWRPRCVTTTS
jgi:hypothetical protein